MSQPQLVRLDNDGDIAVMVIDNPPVNALSPAVAAQMRDAVDAFERSPQYRALVVSCVGRTFVAGGDIASFNDPGFSATPLNGTLAWMERLRRPVVAALHGHVLGGGLELAMACHWRIADTATRLGLPEIKLGLIPGSLGTQRLPRLVGLARGYKMIASGDSVAAPAALAWGLIDQVADSAAAQTGIAKTSITQTGTAHAPVTQAGIAYARQLLASGAGPRATRDRVVDTTGVPAGFFIRQRQLAYQQRARFPASLALVDALEATTAPFEVGELIEARGFELLRRSPESKALRYLFFAQRKAPRPEAGPAQTPGDRTYQAFMAAITRLQGQGVSRIRLAHALHGYGFSKLPPGYTVEPGSAMLLDEPQLIQPLLDAVVNEGARLLQDGLYARASDMDVAWTRDHGFPSHLGGPLYNADELGLARVVQRLGDDGIKPCRLLCTLASEVASAGTRLSDHCRPEPAHPPDQA